jgi:hypothetical protein
LGDIKAVVSPACAGSAWSEKVCTPAASCRRAKSHLGYGEPIDESIC